MTTENTEHSPTLGTLAKALAAAQAELQDAKKDCTNPHFKNRYASLASVRDALKSVLPRHGLSTVQTTTPHGDAGVCVVTWLLHESGEWLRGELFLPVAKKDPQGFGSALSYARRYALAAIVGIAAEDDDDANVAVPTNGKPALAKVETSPSREETALVEAFATARDAKEIAVAELSAAEAIKAGKGDRARLLKARAEAMARVGVTS